MSERIIAQADLSGIENRLNVLYNNIDAVRADVVQIDDNIRVVYQGLGQLMQEFHEFVQVSEAQHNLSVAETRLVKIRQEIDTKYGHYGEIRRTLLGILQADDLGIIKRETISNVTEELMLSTPGYWLAPCLVALAAWINDQKELSDKALREAIKRDDEKTSLFFALICRRAERKEACLKWTQRYLENQDAEFLDHKAVIILDAFASGLLGPDSEGLVARQMKQWLDYLMEKPGFVENQKRQWINAISLKKPYLVMDGYEYLLQYSNTSNQITQSLQDAYLHGRLFDYFDEIFKQERSNATLEEQLDTVLESLVKNYDAEELPLRKEERLNQLIVNYSGDMERVQEDLALGEDDFDTHKDFAALLTDAAMSPETAHSSVSTQKFAIALSKDWIKEAYQDVLAQSRANVPHEIEINFDNFHSTTVDGSNENEVINQYIHQMNQEEENMKTFIKPSSFDNFMLFASGFLILISMVTVKSNIALGLILFLVSVGMILNYLSKKKKLDAQKENIHSQFEVRRQEGCQIIRAVIAGVVNFRREFQERDRDSEKVLTFLEQLNSGQYVNKMALSSRKVKLN